MNQSDKDAPATAAPLTAEQIVDIVGPLTDARIMAIIATGATIEEVEEAAAWAEGESDVMGDLGSRTSGPVAAVYDVLTAEEKYEGDRD